MESLKVSYHTPGKINFEFDRIGACEQHEKGIALIKPCWWLGVETDDNAVGEAVAVQEYIFHKNSGCKMYLRIDEDGWSQATITVAPECSGGCPSSGKPMLRSIDSGKPDKESSRRSP
jgi:hypothetical protein